MVTIGIDGHRKKASDGLTILETAREMGIYIPTLCYHEALAPAGACRLCVVEVRVGERDRVMASCVTPVENGMYVTTDSERIRSIRRTLLELLLARCPHIPIIRTMAREYGIDEPHYVQEDEDCFLCGLCVRACQEIVGMSAIGFAFRGIKEIVTSPFSETASTCISCGTCTTVCPARTFDVHHIDRATSMHTFAQRIKQRMCTICEHHYTAGD